MFGISQTQIKSYNPLTSTQNVGLIKQFQGVSEGMLEHGRVPRSTPPSSK